MPDGITVTVMMPNGHKEPLPWRLEWVHHSPTGLEWGYGGSGPHQLALAILGLLLTRQNAQRLHGQFCDEVVAHIGRGPWYISRLDIERRLIAWGEPLPPCTPAVQRMRDQ